MFNFNTTFKQPNINYNSLNLNLINCILVVNKDFYWIQLY